MAISQDAVVATLEGHEALPNGVAAAAILASGIGCAVLGLLTVLPEASVSITGVPEANASIVTSELVSATRLGSNSALAAASSSRFFPAPAGPM